MPDKNKAKPKYKSIPKFNHNNASAIYNIARKLGANDTLARAILGVTHVETYPVSKYVKGNVWDYKNHVIERAFSARPYTRGLFHYDMMGPSSDEQKKAAKAKGEYPFENIYRDDTTWGYYQKFLKDNNLIDSPEAQIGFHLIKYSGLKSTGKGLEELNKMSLDDAVKTLDKAQKHNNANGFKQALERAKMLEDWAPTKDYYGEVDEIDSHDVIDFNELKHGGMIKNISTLKAYPRRRRYAGGGEVAFRDRFGDVQGHSYGAEKGIQGATVRNTASIAGGIGTAAGTAVGATALAGSAIGSWMPGIGTALGALVGGIVGLFTGRKKRRKAKKAAEEADRQRQIVAGNERILQDELKLSNTAQQEGALDMYGDSNITGVTGYQDDASFGSDLVQPTVQGTPFGDVDPSSAFGRIAARCGGRLKRKRCGGKARRYADGGMIEETSSNTAEVNGPSHEQGGVPYGPNAEVEGGEALMIDADNAYVFSDTLKYNGTTFADLAKPLMKHKGYLESSLPVKSMMLGRMLSLTDRSTYAIDRNTNGRNAEKANADLQRTNAQIAAIQNELAQLYNLQESMKAEFGMEAEPIEARCGGRIKRKCGGKIRKYYDGGQIVDSPVSTYGIKRIDSGSTIQEQGLTFTSNDKTQIQNPLTTIQQGLRCGGRTRKYAGGGFISPGFVSEVGGNLIGGISQLITNKGLIDRMESMRVPETPLMDRIELETDINTDAEIGDINNTVRSLEKYITSNSSNSQVARQSILLARTQGSRMRSRVKQDEHNKEVELRNRSRMANAEIAARNSQIRAENEANKFNHQMEVIQRRSQQGAAIGDMIASLGRSIGTAYQSKFDRENLQTANLISVLKDDKSRDYIFDNMPKDTLMRMFGISSLKDLKKIQGGSTVPKRSLRTKRLNRRGSVVPDAVTMPDYYYNFA
jgi:hypothetical protein